MVNAAQGPGHVDSNPSATQGEGRSRREFLGAAAALGVGTLGGAPLLSRRVRMSGRPSIELPAVERLSLTCVMDSGFDDSQKSSEQPGLTIQRPPSPRSAAVAGDQNRYLRAEYGLSLLLESEAAGETTTVLHDFGLTSSALLNNLTLLGFDPAAVDALVLSHGHGDHFGGLPGLLAEHGPKLRGGLPFHYGHENAFADRWKVKGEARSYQGRLQRESLTRGGLTPVRTQEPVLVGGQLLLSGSIPMESEHERVSKSAKVVVDGELESDDFREELALAYHLADKGLVVITACGHRGMVNTVRHLRRITGIDTVHAVIGGLHLAKFSQGGFDESAEELERLDVQHIVPMHCTGLTRTGDLSRRFAQRAPYNVTGSVYRLS